MLRHTLLNMGTHPEKYAVRRPTAVRIPQCTCINCDGNNAISNIILGNHHYKHGPLLTISHAESMPDYSSVQNSTQNRNMVLWGQ